MTPDTLSVSITAMNIMDGVEHAKYWEVLQPAWEEEGFGFIEFCGWLTELGIMSEEMLEERQPQDFPGVYDYEVSYELGQQITQYVLTFKRLPSEVDCRRWLSILADGFFRQGGV